MRVRSSPPRGSHGPSCRRTPATAPSTILAWMPVNHCQCGARRVGFIPTIRADGSNGIAATTWAGEYQKRMRDRSGAGTLCVATWRRSNATANTVIRPAESARGRPSYTGPTIAERSDCRTPRPAPAIVNVGFGSLADITARSRHVRFTPDSGHSSVQVGCPKSARSGHGAGAQKVPTSKPTCSSTFRQQSWCDALAMNTTEIRS